MPDRDHFPARVVALLVVPCLPFVHEPARGAIAPARSVDRALGVGRAALAQRM